MVCIQVTYSDHQVGHFPVSPDEGWRIDSALRMLVIGRGVPRKMIPLDGIQVVELVPSRDEASEEHDLGDGWPTDAPVDLMLRQLRRDRETPYWGEQPHSASLDGAEAWLLSLRDHLEVSGRG